MYALLLQLEHLILHGLNNLLGIDLCLGVRDTYSAAQVVKT